MYYESVEMKKFDNIDLQNFLRFRYKSIIFDPLFDDYLEFHIVNVIEPYTEYLAKGPFKKQLSKYQWEE